MKRVLSILLFFILLTLLSSKSIFALDPHATGSAIVTARVIGTSINPPILITPDNNSVTNNQRLSFVWKRPDPLPATPLHHYDLYIDGKLFASSISDSIDSQTYYFYKITRSNDTFTLELLTNLTDGYHTWNVTVYDNSNINANSETRTFYIDSIAPFINLEKVDKQTLNWNTSNPNSIPNVNERDILVTTKDPLLTGKVEPYANMQISLICPQNIPDCQNQIYQGNYPSGIWQHRFYGLIKGQVYTVYIMATDAGGNSTIFPVFYLAYGVITPTTTATITTTPTTVPVSPTTTPVISISLTPEPTPEIVVPFTPIPPAAPTPPPAITTPTKAPSNFFLQYWYLILLILGLPLHLAMIIIGAKINFSHLLNFLYAIFFPFFAHKEYQTVPFATLYFYDPEKLDKTWQTKISDIKGFYSLKSPILEKLFIKITCTGRTWKDVIINGNLLPISCLYPISEDSTMSSDTLQLLLMRFRSITLIIACITSLFLLIISPNYLFLIYLYLSLQLVFSEYIYPRL